MSKLSKLVKKVVGEDTYKSIKSVAPMALGGTQFAGTKLALDNPGLFLAGAGLATGNPAMFSSGLNLFPGAQSQMPGFTDISPSGGNILDIYLAERRRKDEIAAARKAEENKLVEKTAAYNRDITVAQIQAQSQFYSQLAAAGGPSAAFPGGWLPGSNTLNVPPGNYGSFPNVNARVTQQDKPRGGMSMQPWMIYVGFAALALVMLPFLVRGK